MTRFGDFRPLCQTVPSYPWCNLFYRQLSKVANGTNVPTLDPPVSAPVGIEPRCGIPRVGTNGSIGNIANIILCALSIFLTVVLIVLVGRRRAAVGRVELRSFLVLYLITLPLQLISTGSVLEQGSTPLVVITAVHAGFVAALFWALLANGVVATQVVEDGTASAMIPFGIGSLAFLGGTLYVALDTGMGFTNAFKSTPPADLHNIPLFVLTSIWPAVATLIYFAIMAYIVLGVLNEVRPMWYYVLSAALFVLGQLARFLLSRVICSGSSAKVDGSFLGTLLETAAVVILWGAWKGITEESWDEDAYYPS